MRKTEHKKLLKQLKSIPTRQLKKVWTKMLSFIAEFRDGVSTTFRSNNVFEKRES